MPTDVTEGYIRVRVKEPGLFVDTSFRIIDISTAKGIKAIIGKLKTDPEGSTITQAFLFIKEKWSVSEAEQWVKDHEKSADAMARFEKVVEYKGVNITLKNFNDEERSFEATASTETQDRDGDILRAAGWQLKNFNKNPILLWAHKYDELPIGRVDKIWTEENKLKFKPIFAGADVYPFADTVYKMYKANFLNAFSVGFNPMQWSFMEEGKKGREFLQQELLEISSVPVPSNFEALTDKDIQKFMLKQLGIKKCSNCKVISDTKIEPTITNKINSNSLILNPIEIKNMKELQELVELHKSGRVLSEKNRQTISDCLDCFDDMNSTMKEAKGMLNDLMNMSNNNNEGNSINSEIEKQLIETRKILDNKK